MSEIVEDLQRKAKTAGSFVQLGVGVGESLKEAMLRFYDVLRDVCARGKAKELKEAYKELKGKKFREEGKFILNAKMDGRNHFTQTSVSKEELKDFQKLCKQYGIDYLFQKRPANLEDLFEKQKHNEPLSGNQKKILDAFTIKDEEGNLHLKDDAALITFSEDDLDVMEKVVDKMEERTYSIEQRKIKAENVVKKAKEKIGKTKEKAKAPVDKSK